MVETETARTATNVLVFSLRALSTISHGIPLTEVLSGTIDSLLEITTPIKQTSVNAQGFAQLAARLELLTTILTQVAQEYSGKEQLQVIVQNLQKELDLITTDLKAASARGKLDQFFNSVDNASILHKHNNALAQMIAKSTFTTVQDVDKSLRELENSKMQDSHVDNVPNGLYDVAGETGFMGDNGSTGGEGGEGAGPQLEMDPDAQCKIGKVSGGTGGPGGNGVERGGKGGTGKGPLINMRRGRLGARVMAKKPQAGEEDSLL
ncbi:hypothetical protein C8R45DRAFT_1009657 [Mycena sanguinolenta]|nr:hypothetical protein C8R45DRAFT_1009657 [Mycena sanguinolenta]